MLRCGRAPTPALHWQPRHKVENFWSGPPFGGTRISKRTHGGHHSSNHLQNSSFESAGVRRLGGISCYLTYDEATELDIVVRRYTLPSIIITPSHWTWLRFFTLLNTVAILLVQELSRYSQIPMQSMINTYNIRLFLDAVAENVSITGASIAAMDFPVDALNWS